MGSGRVGNSEVMFAATRTKTQLVGNWLLFYLLPGFSRS
jgi:hypothetical protein